MALERTATDGRAHQLLAMEHALVRSIALATPSPAIIRLMRWASHFGDRGLSITVGLLIASCCGLWPFLAWLASTVVALLVQKSIKRRFGRRRPCEHPNGPPQRAPIPDKGSFPSGHTLHAVMGAVLITSLVPPVAPAFIALAVVIAMSRVILGVHYPSDVVAGAALGALLATAVIAVI
jgi:undecaprenyl-diphosphatase